MPGTREKAHYFSVLGSAGSAVSVLTSQSVPPECPEHRGSTVVRNGTYGKSVAKRQRYRCTPKTGEEPHDFTPSLAREWVDTGSETCATCYDLLTPHQGEMAVARRSPWSLRAIVASLNDLSLGASYASVSLDLRRRGREMSEHLASAHGLTLPATAESRSQSATARDAKSAWHLAADMVEQYSPVLFEATMADVRKREKRRRQANDAALRKNPQARLASPIVYILDELPIHIRRKATSGPRVQSSQYNLLVVVELLWKPGRKGQALPDREARLRLVRAYPRANEEAWRLVLAELGTRPDFVVADCADAITNAVRNQYQGTVGLIPSFFHVARNLRESLLKLPGATTTLDKRVVLIPELAKHLEQLSRDEALNLTARDWSRWWDELLAMVDALSAPRTGIAAQRTVYEKRIAAALPLLRAQPQLPASNAAVETRIRLTLDPFLEGRKFRYRNLASTNFLLDLAVCRSQGLFADPDRISRLIRDHNMAHRGWSLAPRTLADAQLPPPPSALSSSPGGEDDTDPFSGGSSASTTARGQAYSSLLNPFIVSALYAKRVAS